MIEHADYLAGFVVDDGAGLGIVECGDCEAARVVGVGGEIDFTNVRELWVDGIWRHVLAGERLVRGDKAPA